MNLPSGYHWLSQAQSTQNSRQRWFRMWNRRSILELIPIQCITSRISTFPLLLTSLRPWDKRLMTLPEYVVSHLLVLYLLYLFASLNNLAFFLSISFMQCTKKVIEESRPRFRNLTNPLYTPIVALKYADETGGLSVHAFYHMLFNLGPLMHFSMTAMKYLTCGCLRSRTVSPH